MWWSSELQREALRRWIAGDLPNASGTDAKRTKAKEKALGEAVRSAQRGAAALREAWRAAGARELARRAEHEGGKEGTRV